MIFSFIAKRNKKTHETRSTNFSEIAKNRFPIRHRQMRIFYQKYQISKPENNTQKYQKRYKIISNVCDWSIFENLKNIQKKIKLRNFV